MGHAFPNFASCATDIFVPVASLYGVGYKMHTSFLLVSLISVHPNLYVSLSLMSLYAHGRANDAGRRSSAPPPSGSLPLVPLATGLLVPPLESASF